MVFPPPRMSSSPLTLSCLRTPTPTSPFQALLFLPLRCLLTCSLPSPTLRWSHTNTYTPHLPSLYLSSQATVVLFDVLPGGFCLDKDRECRACVGVVPVSIACPWRTARSYSDLSLRIYWDTSVTSKSHFKVLPLFLPEKKKCYFFRIGDFTVYRTLHWRSRRKMRYYRVTPLHTCDKLIPRMGKWSRGCPGWVFDSFLEHGYSLGQMVLFQSRLLPEHIGNDTTDSILK